MSCPLQTELQRHIKSKCRKLNFAIERSFLEYLSIYWLYSSSLSLRFTKISSESKESNKTLSVGLACSEALLSVV